MMTAKVSTVEEDHSTEDLSMEDHSMEDPSMEITTTINVAAETIVMEGDHVKVVDITKEIIFLVKWGK